ncbi:DUF5681 domain-containing protein [Brevundimonas subvibrioides]|uniref:DUF5681 domain-containing protein n=1 Tax=Brevundimonas subvibrioides TaxID=74313 RepID=UPI0022B5993D|nr:DUF5681 domain-containing protein [Brevundimonas subvibrioides]
MNAAPRIRVRVRAPENEEQADTPAAKEAVGYRSPPIASRFKTGQSGNAKGRPKGSRNIETLYREVLDMKITTAVGGKKQTITALKAVLMKQMQKALAGDFRSMEAVIEAQIKYAENREARAEARELGDRSRGILERARERMRLDLAAEMGCPS